MMNRRDLIRNAALVSGASVLSSNLFMSCASDSYELTFFHDAQFKLIEALSEFILPRTDGSPGAADAKVAQYLDAYVSHCLTAQNQEKIIGFIATCAEYTNQKYQNAFHTLTHQEKAQVLDHFEAQPKTAANHYQKVKSMILFSYFTSQEGMTKALAYLPVPQRYDGNIMYQKGDKAWALG